MTKEERALNEFGEFLMREARDNGIEVADWVLDGKAASPFDKELHKRIAATFTQDQLDLICYLVPMFIDSALHYMLWALEGTELIDISVKLDSEVVPTLRGAGDGMEGDMFDWIRKYSTQRYDYLDDRDNFFGFPK